tara:strand:+ start:11958 stop:12302 length:345 start_codon:yes stop_codon:yes gene_type:complete
MRKKMTPEQQNDFIQQMASSSEPIQNETHKFLLGPPKVQPYQCEHCEEVMTKTGRLPAMKDRYSWSHWIGWQLGEYGVQKIHSLGLDSSHGQCCVACFKAFEQWEKEYEAERGE